LKSESVPRYDVQRTEPRCYNCQKMGHIARDCDLPRKPLVCTNCKKEGHTRKYCQMSVPDVNLITTQLNNNLKYYVKNVRINDHEEPIIGLIDTGSAYTIIRKSVAEGLICM